MRWKNKANTKGQVTLSVIPEGRRPIRDLQVPGLCPGRRSHNDTLFRKLKRSLVLGCMLLVTVLATPTFATTPVQRITHHQHAQARRATLYSGSLRRNLSRLAKQYGWKKLVWLPESDYQWVGQVSMRENNAYALFERVLRNYPLQAVFYKGNHVLVIKPRNI